MNSVLPSSLYHSSIHILPSLPTSWGLQTVNQKAFVWVPWRIAMTTVMQSKKAIVRLVAVATCLHAEGAKSVLICSNASWSFWQSWIWTWLGVSQGLPALGADSCESAKSCLAYEDLKVHILLTHVFAVCQHVSRAGVTTTTQWNRVLISNERYMPTLC